jgi:hypothetical protein
MATKTTPGKKTGNSTAMGLKNKTAPAKKATAKNTVKAQGQRDPVSHRVKKTAATPAAKAKKTKAT